MAAIPQRVVSSALLILAAFVGQLAAPSPAGGQTASDNSQLEEAQAIFHKIAADEQLKAAYIQRNPLKEIIALNRLRQELAEQSELADQVLISMLAPAAAAVGDYNLALTNYAANRDVPASELRSCFDASVMTCVDAVTAIYDVARDERVLMFNEAHHDPRHRALVAQLLPKFRTEGFTTLAVEALAEDQETLASRGYPTHGTGHYTREPTFANLLRIALKHGYRVVPYDVAASDPPPEREHAQAQQLATEVEEGKMIVLAGFDHIKESNGFAGHAAMAELFSDLTGIDPLTIDQVDCSIISFDRGVATDNALAKALPAGPHVLRMREGELWCAAPESYDLSVVHPPMVTINGRPRWIRGVGQKVEVNLPKGSISEETQTLIQAYAVAEGPDAVPVDQFIVEPYAQPPALLLPPGEYRVLATTSSDETILAKSVVVPASHIIKTALSTHRPGHAIPRQ